jgi:hypothetical protein
MDTLGIAAGRHIGSPDATERLLLAITTRKRPRMLANCLAACFVAERPQGTSVTILVVDNDPDESGRAVVGEVAAASAVQVDYVMEPQPGIPAVRNRAIDIAASRGAKWLAFIDDDSFPDPKWLTVLIDALRREKAQFAGGPILFGAPEERMSIWRRFICRGLVASSHRRQWWRTRHGRRNADNMVITTANWCVDLPWFLGQGLRFDGRFAQSGGSDTAMDRAIRGKGAKVVFELTSVVTEILPAERLTLRYQFLRRMHSGMVRGYQRRSHGRYAQVLRKAITDAAFSLLGAVVLIPTGMLSTLVIPSLGAQLIISAARMAGRGVGFIRGALSDLPQQYRKIQGY